MSVVVNDIFWSGGNFLGAFRHSVFEFNADYRRSGGGHAEDRSHHDDVTRMEASEYPS